MNKLITAATSDKTYIYITYNDGLTIKYPFDKNEHPTDRVSESIPEMVGKPEIISIEREIVGRKCGCFTLKFKDRSQRIFFYRPLSPYFIE